MKNKKRQKKAAIEMSLNLIILLIIGLTVLALVIGFVNNLINKGESQFTGQLNNAQQQERENVLNKPGTFAFGPSSLRIKPGEAEKMFIKLGNRNEIGGTSLVVDANQLDGSGGTIGGTNTETKVAIQDVIGDCGLTGATIATPGMSVSAQEDGVFEVAIGTDTTKCSVGDSFFVSLTVSVTPDGNGAVAIVKTATVTVDIVE